VVDITIPDELSVYWIYSDDDQNARTVSFPASLGCLPHHHQDGYPRGSMPG
jgi:hypothetical protein